MEFKRGANKGVVGDAVKHYHYHYYHYNYHDNERGRIIINKGVSRYNYRVRVSGVVKNYLINCTGEKSISFEGS